MDVTKLVTGIDFQELLPQPESEPTRLDGPLWLQELPVAFFTVDESFEVSDARGGSGWKWEWSPR